MKWATEAVSVTCMRPKPCRDRRVDEVAGVWSKLALARFAQMNHAPKSCFCLDQWRLGIQSIQRKLPGSAHRASNLTHLPFPRLSVFPSANCVPLKYQHWPSKQPQPLEN